jgi:hypothetical protein
VRHLSIAVFQPSRDTAAPLGGQGLFSLEYKAADPDGLGFSQFKLRLSEWQKASGRGPSMRQVHHAGETVQVDYAGDTVVVVDCCAENDAHCSTPLVNMWI